MEGDGEGVRRGVAQLVAYFHSPRAEVAALNLWHYHNRANHFPYPVSAPDTLRNPTRPSLLLLSYSPFQP